MAFVPKGVTREEECGDYRIRCAFFKGKCGIICLINQTSPKITSEASEHGRENSRRAAPVRLYGHEISPGTGDGTGKTGTRRALRDDAVSHRAPVWYEHPHDYG